MSLKLGIIGYGGMGGWHHKNAGRVDGVDVIGAYDIDPERVKAATEAGLKGYSTLKSILDDPEINIILVSTPNNVHKELAVAAINAGKHVIVEKPVAMSVAELDEIIDASEKKNVVFTVHQNRRWDKDFQTARKAIEDGLLGNVYTIESRVHGSGGKIHGWRAVKECGGGMVLDWGVHLLDQIMFMLPNKIDTVYAQLFSVLNPDVDDYFKILLRFDNGLSAQVEVGTFCLRGLPRWYICGDSGALTIQSFDAKEGGITRVRRLAEEFAPVIVETSAGPTRTFAPQPEETRENLELPEVNPSWTDFYKNVNNVVEGKEELVVKPCQVRRVFRVMEAAFKSQELGQAIKFAE